MTANVQANKDEAVAVELRLDRLARLYNSLDPSPFKDKELDAAADEYIVGSAQELGGRPMRLVVLLSEPELKLADAADIIASIRGHFLWRAQVESRRLSSELRRGRRSLAIGLVFLVVCLVVRQLIGTPETGPTHILREGLLIVGWVAMWGPIEIFLYAWWPIAGRRRLFEQLARTDVEVRPLK
ncbi:MAG: hypothetical protein KIT25_13015 [Enhydrobacter sp.]|nr:MAG: hypothetical protein KIT25_13015 [Enhydrobacter sp.]